MVRFLFLISLLFALPILFNAQTPEKFSNIVIQEIDGVIVQENHKEQGLITHVVQPPSYMSLDLFVMELSSLIDEYDVEVFSNWSYKKNNLYTTGLAVNKEALVVSYLQEDPTFILFSWETK